MSRQAVIIDTNVVVAGLLTGNATSPVARILDGMLAAAFPFVVSEALLAEYRAVLVRPALRKQHGLTVAEVEDWREKFLVGAENALRTRPKDADAVKDEQIKKLKQKIGDLVLDNDILQEALKPYPLDRKTSDA